MAPGKADGVAGRRLPPLVCPQGGAEMRIIAFDWLYFSTRSPRQGAPVFKGPVQPC
jgi:hypothetical protein